MKIVVNIKKSYFFAIIAVLLIIGIVGIGYAYNSGRAPSQFGHSSEEIEVNIPGVGVRTLNDAIQGGLIGGSGGTLEVMKKSATNGGVTTLSCDPGYNIVGCTCSHTETNNFWDSRCKILDTTSCRGSSYYALVGDNNYPVSVDIICAKIGSGGLGNGGSGENAGTLGSWITVNQNIPAPGSTGTGKITLPSQCAFARYVEIQYTMNNRQLEELTPSYSYYKDSFGGGSQLIVVPGVSKRILGFVTNNWQASRNVTVEVEDPGSIYLKDTVPVGDGTSISLLLTRCR